MAKQRQTLRSAVREALGGISRQALDQRVERLGKKVPMTPDDAAAVIGHQNNVDISRFLDATALSRVSNYVTQLNGTPTFLEPRARSRAGAAPKQVVIEIGGIKMGEIPGLTVGHAKEARIMAEKVYAVLYVFENSVRDVITRVLKAAFGADWWSHVPLEVRNQAEFNKKKEGQEAWHSKRGKPIQFVDLPQLKGIVNDPDLWPYFKPIFTRQTWFDSVVDDVNVSRRVSAHMNPLSDDDIKSVENGFRKWVKQLQAKKAELPEDDA